jgi:hypothetical protein
MTYKFPYKESPYIVVPAVFAIGYKQAQVEPRFIGKPYIGSEKATPREYFELRQLKWEGPSTLCRDTLKFQRGNSPMNLSFRYQLECLPAQILIKSRRHRVCKLW